jgi:hypothetical protein
MTKVPLELFYRCLAAGRTNPVGDCLTGATNRYNNGFPGLPPQISRRRINLGRDGCSQRTSYRAGDLTPAASAISNGSPADRSTPRNGDQRSPAPGRTAEVRQCLVADIRQQSGHALSSVSGGGPPQSAPRVNHFHHQPGRRRLSSQILLNADDRVEQSGTDTKTK